MIFSSKKKRNDNFSREAFSPMVLKGPKMMYMEDDIKHYPLSVPQTFKAWAPRLHIVSTLNIWNNLGASVTTDVKKWVTTHQICSGQRCLWVSHGCVRGRPAALTALEGCCLCTCHLFLFLAKAGDLTLAAVGGGWGNPLFPEMYAKWCGNPCHFFVEMLLVSPQITERVLVCPSVIQLKFITAVFITMCQA